MRNQTPFFILSFCLLQLACGRQIKVPDSYGFKPPKVIEAKANPIPLQRIASPTVILVSGVKKVVAGKPEIVHLTTNVFTAKANQMIAAATPQLFIPNGGGFVAPTVVPAIDSPFVAGHPEIILLKEPFSKELNTESFSAIKALHGLNSNEISSLYEDRAGNLWIGAWWGGVSKYNGGSLTNYSVAQGLSSDVVNCILEDRSGNLWIGTVDGGVNKFDGTYITRYSTREGVSDNFIASMLEDKNGNIWFATGNGLTKYDGQSFTHFTTAQGLSSNVTWSLLEDSQQNLWVGTNGGVAKFDGHSFQNYTLCLGLKEDTEVNGLLEDNNGTLWFATSNGLYKHNGDSISQFTAEGGLSSNRLSKMTMDASGNIWIGTWDHGAIRFDGKSFTHFGPKQGLGNEVVPAILQDKRGTIWLATTAGVNKYDGNLFRHLVPLKQEEVECLLADKKGNIWMGSGAGNCINLYNGKTLSRYTTAQGLGSTAINQIIEDRNGAIWFGSRGGAIRFDGKSFTQYTSENGLLDNLVFCLLEDKNGVLWFGTQSGLSKFDGASFTNYSKPQGLQGGIFSLMEDHLGTIWIGTSNNGVYSFDGINFTHYNLSNSVSHPMVIGMMEDKNRNIWFCTGMGLNKFDGTHFTLYTTEQGLSNNIVKNVLQDRYGNIWIGTINGINLLREEKTTAGTLKNTPLSVFKRYTVSEGFLGGGSYENSITEDSNGNIWIGATDRVARYYPQGDIPDSIPPTLQLSRIALFDEDINWREAEKQKDSTIVLHNGKSVKHLEFSGLSPWYNQPENLQLQYDNNYITFHFTGATTYRPKEVQYQYILEGLDNHWSTISDKPEATYNNLPHGKYVFKVKAVNSDGYWSKELTYPFTIKPPWWRTWWAYLLYAGCFIFGIWVLTLYRSRRLKAENRILEEKVDKRTKELAQSLEEKYLLLKKVESQEALLKERLRISRELHDDIGSTLGSISIYSEVAKKHIAKKENTTEVLSKIGHASRELIDKMSDIVWSLNPNNEGFEQLQNRMAAFSAMILAPRNIYYAFKVTNDVKGIHFTTEQRRSIFLIFKEALYNIVKYATCKQVSIQLALQNDHFSMTIQDDGKGFNAHCVSTNRTTSTTAYLGGNGMKNMQVRADEMNATLCIDSSLNLGTTVQLSLPL